MKKLLLSLTLYISSATIAFACSCIGITSFCETTIYNEKVAIVEVINKTENGYSFDVKVIEKLTPNIEEEFISINYYLTSCSHFLDVNIGDELIINFNMLNTHEDAPYPCYDFSTCAVNFLNIEGNNVVGKINDLEDTTISLSTFVNEFDSCLDLIDITTSNSFLKRLFKIKGNPTKDQLKVRLPYINDDTTIAIFDCQGRILNTVKNIVENDQTINIQGYSAGIYFCAYNYRGITISKKFIVL